MTTNQTPFDDYLIEVQRHARRVLKHRGAPNVDDVASHVVVSASASGPELMSRYSPTAYARIRAPHALIEFDRRERVQRGEGGRLRHLSDGTIEASRQVVRFDTITDSGRGANSHESGDQVFPSELYGRIRDAIGPDRAATLFKVAVLDRPIQEVATDLGIRRETLSRQLSESRRMLQAALLPNGDAASV